MANMRGQQRRTGRSHGQPHYQLDADVSEKLKEIESSGEPMSIAETISREEARPLANMDKDKIPSEDVINVTDLQRMPAAELAKHAEAEGVVDAEGMSKRDLIFRILKERVKSRGIMCGEGTLQILA